MASSDELRSNKRRLARERERRRLVRLHRYERAALERGFTFIGGVKYRPLKEYRQFLASRIQRRGEPPKRRRGRP